VLLAQKYGAQIALINSMKFSKNKRGTVFCVLVFCHSLLAFEIAIEPKPFALPHLYRIQIEIQGFNQSLHTAVFHRRDRQGNWDQVHLKQEQQIFIDSSVTAAGLYEYDVMILSQNGALLKKSIAKVSVPKDLVITKDMSLDSELVWRVGRLYLDNKVSWITQGYPLKIVALELHSQQAHLMSFPPGEGNGIPVKVGKNGNHGSSQEPVQFFALRAFGLLNLTLTGGNGGDGGPGKDGAIGKKGVKGKPGKMTRHPETSSTRCVKSPTDGGYR